MKIAVASGKGGTGKTTVATNLAWVAARDGWSVAYLDCDVEEPNGHLFLKPQATFSRRAARVIQQVNASKCAHCGLCGEICQYSAIVCVGSNVLVYPELCHACGGCTLVCRPGAITEIPHEIGVVEAGVAGPIQFYRGLLDVGEAMSAPLIRQVKAAALDADLVLIDSPPGTSCSVIESVRGSDYVVLVTEPTPFGLNDLKLAVEMARDLRLPVGIVINRARFDDNETHKYARHEGIEILAEISDDRRVAEAYSRGALACDAIIEFRASIQVLLSRIQQQVVPSEPAAGREAAR